ILAATRQPWLIIDPRGVIGEREYEVVALLRNPIPGIYATSELQQVLERRIAILQEMLGFNRQRMIGWGVAHCVLSAWWSYESDDINWADVLQCADALSNMLNGK
ncbi:MAG: aminoglycoside resistance protein, partial [Chloroflexi bacterium]